MISLVVFSSNSVSKLMLDLRMDRKKLQYSDSRGRVK